MSKRFSRFWVRCFLCVLFLGSFIFCLWLGYSPSTARETGRSTSSNAEQIVERGVQLYQQGELTQSIAQWQTALKIYQNSDNKADAAIVLENLARAYQQIGQNNSAIDYWQKAIDNYRQLGNIQQLGRSLTEQAQAYSRIGQHRIAIALLCNSNSDCLSGTALQIARQQKDLPGEAAALGSLGEAYRLRGDYTKAIAYLKSSLIADRVNNSQISVSALNSLGNARSSLAQVSYRRAESASGRGDKQQSDLLSQKALQEDRQALADLQMSLQLASDRGDSLGQMKAMLNSIPVYYRTGNSTNAASKVQQALSLLDSLPDRRDKIYAAIDLAKLLQPEINSFDRCLQPQLQPQAIALLQKAAEIAENIQDNRAQSFAFGAWGHIYECRQEYEQALKLTQQARLAAEQDLQNQDSLYQWEWQTGRIFKAQEQPEIAIAAYEKAIATLEAIRDNILTANRDIQFDFRDRIEPIYRDLVALKLNQIPSFTTIKNEPTVVNLNSALDNIDSLRLAELQNYFGNDCAIREFSQATTVTSPDDRSAIFSSIILPNRTGIVVSFPNRTKKIAWLDRNRDSLRQEIIEFRRGLGRYFDGNYDTQQAQKIYGWLIAPFAADFKQQQIKTLVFIQDGILRSIPMSALHDGKQFLIEQYAIATTPSLKLTDFTKINRPQLKALALGFNEEAKIDNRLFRPLPKVSEEINSIEQELKGSKGLLNQEFTRDRLQQELNQTTYDIVHIATHGEFGAEPEDTFLITGDRRKLTIAGLDEIIRSTPKGTSQIELLSLTACKTAIGDERAALGLAGVAVQAGVRSVLASLWSIEDTVTPQIVEQFYTALQNPSLNKAQALQQAQIKLIKEGRYAHPAYWSPFILIGNWL